MKGQFTRSRTGIKLSLIDTNSQSISRNWVTILGVCTEFRSYSTLRNFVEFCYNKASITYVTIPRQTIVFREFVNQRRFGAFLFHLFHDKAIVI